MAAEIFGISHYTEEIMGVINILYIVGNNHAIGLGSIFLYLLFDFWVFFFLLCFPFPGFCQEVKEIGTKNKIIVQ